MINTESCLAVLKDTGEIPDDSEVVSTNNKVVTVSGNEGIVARISSDLAKNQRDDPHDLRYSHSIAWHTGIVAPAVRPLEENPIISNGYVISRYPLLRSGPDLNKYPSLGIYNTIRKFGDALECIEDKVALQKLNVAKYVLERLGQMDGEVAFDQQLVGQLGSMTDFMQTHYPFMQLAEDDTALVHGDVKADNFVTDHTNNLKFIDLDAAAIGPRLYDLASWRLRSETGDFDGVKAIAEIGQQTDTWNEESYRALIGWKAISSMSFTLRYEPSDVNQNNFRSFLQSARVLRAPFANEAKSV